MNHAIRMTVLLGLAATTALANTDGKPQSRSKDSEGAQEVSRFENAKKSVAGKPARPEKTRLYQYAKPHSLVSRSDRALTDEEAGIQEAVRFERAKAAPAERQARIEARQPSGYAEPTSSANSADRQFPANK